MSRKIKHLFNCFVYVILYLLCQRKAKLWKITHYPISTAIPIKRKNSPGNFREWRIFRPLQKCLSSCQTPAVCGSFGCFAIAKNALSIFLPLWRCPAPRSPIIFAS